MRPILSQGSKWAPNLDGGDRALAKRTIQERLDTGVWERISTEKVRQGRHVSMEFIVTNLDRKMQSMARLSHLSRFWNHRSKKLFTLESCAFMLQLKDRMMSFDFEGG